MPGVTTPLGIAAYTGVPLTHRDHTSAVTFVTGHAVEAIDWDKVGHVETLVIFMGLMHFPAIARELIARGRDPETPAMAVRWATRPDQETLTGTLATLPELLVERGMKPPATIVVGEVVRLRGKLNWYERLPLFGKRIVVTRAREQADALSARLRALGADVHGGPHDRDLPGGGLRAPGRGHRRTALLRLAHLHERQRRPLLSSNDSTARRPISARCGRASARLDLPRAPRWKPCT